MPIDTATVTLPDVRRLRGMLAEAQVSHREFARTCGLSRVYIGRILNGYVPGELAAIKVRRGIACLVYFQPTFRSGR